MEEVELINDAGHRKAFRVDHARAILASDKKFKRVTWSLTNDSPYTLAANGDLIRRSSSGADKSAEVLQGDTRGKGKKVKAQPTHGGEN